MNLNQPRVTSSSPKRGWRYLLLLVPLPLGVALLLMGISLSECRAEPVVLTASCRAASSIGILLAWAGAMLLCTVLLGYPIAIAVGVANWLTTRGMKRRRFPPENTLSNSRLIRCAHAALLALPSAGLGFTAYAIQSAQNASMALGVGLLGLLTLIAFLVCGLAALVLGLNRRWGALWGVVALGMMGLWHAAKY